jgi:hypothetical protein
VSNPLAFYGKGGVGKSTVVSNLTATSRRWAGRAAGRLRSEWNKVVYDAERRRQTVGRHKPGWPR